MSKAELLKKEFAKRGFTIQNFKDDEYFEFCNKDCNGDIQVTGDEVSYSVVCDEKEDYNTIHWNNGEVVAIVDYILD